MSFGFLGCYCSRCACNFKAAFLNASEIKKPGIDGVLKVHSARNACFHGHLLLMSGQQNRKPDGESFMYFHNSRPTEAPENAFTFTELLAVLCTIALLALIVLPALAKDADSSERAVCLNNMKRIMAAVAMYSTDNNDHLPHPSWGADMTGPDNWCYATHLPTGQSAPSAAGKGGPDAYTNQIPFYLAGQLARFLESQRVLVCPTDWRESMSTKAFIYVGR